MNIEKSPESKRPRDMDVEKEIGAFLDAALYKHGIFKNVQRFNDKANQFKGIDIVASIPSCGLYDIKIDEKSQSSYENIGNPLPTFALELSSLNIQNKEELGWLIDNKKVTQYYLFIWIDKATKNDNFVKEDIRELTVFLVSRDKILGWLNQKGLTKEKLIETNNEIRKMLANNHPDVYTQLYKDIYKNAWFRCSKKSVIVEQSVNIVIRKEVYYELATIKEKLTVSEDGNTVHIEPI